MEGTFTSVEEILKECDVIYAKISSFWDKHRNVQKMTGKKSEDEVNKLTKNLYDILKEEHKGFHGAYSLLLFSFCRGIYDKTCILAFFDSIKRNGLGKDEEQIKRLAKYTSDVVAKQAIAAGGKVTDSQKRKHKHKIIESMMQTKGKFEEAVKKVQEEREKDKLSSSESSDNTNLDSTKNNEMFDFFSNSKCYETNELFQKSIDIRRRQGYIQESD